MKKKKKEENLRKALKKVQETVQNGLTPNYRKIAAEFDVPKSTLNRRHKKGVIVRGKVFTEEEENYIIEYIHERQSGYPLTKVSFIELVNDYIRVSFYFFIFLFFYFKIRTMEAILK